MVLYTETWTCMIELQACLLSVTPDSDIRFIAKELRKLYIA
jgi:hypothetical protein